MIPKQMDSLETVEMVMALEEIFCVQIPNSDAENFSSPREIVAWLEQNLSNQRPNKAAVALLRKLAKDQDDPELAVNLDGLWRREQIAAIIREIYK